MGPDVKAGFDDYFDDGLVHVLLSEIYVQGDS